MSDTEIAVAGSKANPIENLEIKIKHPQYLSVRATKDIYFSYYVLGKIIQSHQPQMVRSLSSLRQLQMSLKFQLALITCQIVYQKIKVFLLIKFL